MLTKQSEKPKETTAEENDKERNSRSQSNKRVEDNSTGNKQSRQAAKNRTKPRRRIFPIWLRIIVVLTLAAGALIAGLMIGYGVLGDGVPSDALKKETWQHIIDIVTKEK